MLALLASSAALATGIKNIGTSQTVLQDKFAIINVQGSSAKTLFDRLLIPSTTSDGVFTYEIRKGSNLSCEKRIDKMKMEDTKNINDVEVDYECSIQVDLTKGSAMQL